MGAENGPAQEITTAQPLFSLSEFITNEGIDLSTLEIGDEMMDGARLIVIPQLLGRTLEIPRIDCVAWDEQPRDHFDAAKLEKLVSLISESGQRDPSQSAVLLYPDGSLKFLINDGERRFRARKQIDDRFLISVIRATDKEEFFEQSFLKNLGREGHTVIEMAKGYARMFNARREKGMNKADAYDEVARVTGEKLGNIKSHIELLDIPDSLQVLVDKQVLNFSGVTTILGSAKGSEARALEIVSHILRISDVRAIKPANSKTQYHSTFSKERVLAVAQWLRENPNPEGYCPIEQIDAGRGLTRALNVTTATRLQVGEALDQDEIVIPLLRKRQKTHLPQVIANIEEAQERLADLLEMVQKASKPDPMPEAPGMPSFSAWIQERFGQTYGSGSINRKILDRLAQASDAGDEMVAIATMASEMGKNLHKVTPVFMALSRKLAAHGLTIEEARESYIGKRDKWEFRKTYRLRWQEGFDATHLTDLRGEKRTAPVPRPRPAAPRPPAQVAPKPAVQRSTPVPTRATAARRSTPAPTPRPTAPTRTVRPAPAPRLAPPAPRPVRATRPAPAPRPAPPAPRPVRATRPAPAPRPETKKIDDVDALDAQEIAAIQTEVSKLKLSGNDKVLLDLLFKASREADLLVYPELTAALGISVTEIRSKVNALKIKLLNSGLQIEHVDTEIELGTKRFTYGMRLNIKDEIEDSRTTQNPLSPKPVEVKTNSEPVQVEETPAQDCPSFTVAGIRRTILKGPKPIADGEVILLRNELKRIDGLTDLEKGFLSHLIDASEEGNLLTYNDLAKLLGIGRREVRTLEKAMLSKIPDSRRIRVKKITDCNILFEDGKTTTIAFKAEVKYDRKFRLSML